jgi:CheY-like chemotaxis protein
MQENSSLSVLVIDPNVGMRGSLQNMLNQAGINKIEFAVSSGTAIRHVTKRSYDIILCEYDLGSGVDDGQDGQQLLEDMRHHNLIGLLTIFIIITAEGAYSKVVSAAELTPTDYILKPFTVDALGQRITRALERRSAFTPTYQLIAEGNLRAALKSCSEGEAEHPRYAREFARLRAELLVTLKELGEAEIQYLASLEEKPFGWASLGLARTLYAQDRIDEAEALLTQLVQDQPRLMAAYDLLARCQEVNGAPNRAQKTLEAAATISPYMLRRMRQLGQAALEAGDVIVAEKAFKQVVTKARHSEFRNPEDHVNWIGALLKKGDSTQAVGVIRDLERSLPAGPDTDVCMAMSLAMLHEASGNSSAALSEIHAAIGALNASTGLSSRLKIALTRTCLDNRLDREATAIMLGVMNDLASGVSMQQAMGVFVRAGRPDLAEVVGNQLKAQAQQLLNVAIEKTAARDFKGAVQTLLEALNMAPGNLQVLLAATRGILRQVNELGWDHALAEQWTSQIDTIRKLDPAHPQLAALGDDFLAAKRKYGIST